MDEKTRGTLEWVVVLLTAALICVGGIKYHQKHQPIAQAPPPQITPPPVVPEKPKTPAKPNISTPVPAYLDYGQIVQQLNQWKQEAADLTEIGTYGKSSRGTDVYYIRVRNNLDDQPKPKVLITACIHGNEPWSTGCVMAYIGTILSSYGESQEITDLVNSRDIYFVPVVSPDSYPHSRHVDGVDPNRDFPGPHKPNHRSTPAVAAIQNFFNEIKPNAVISGHTHGRIFLHPWGDNTQPCPHHDDFARIIGEMGRLCQYRVIRACQMYGRPIFGTEVDWYYRNGAFSNSPNGRIKRGAFAIVMEFGTHQRIPTHGEIEEEFNRTFKAVLHFIQEAPLVEIWWDEQGNAVNPDGTPKRTALRRAA